MSISSISSFTANTTTSGSQSQSVSTVLADGRIVVAWFDANDTHGTIRCRFFNPNGNPIGAEVLVAEGWTASEILGMPALQALPNGNVAIAWSQMDGTDCFGTSLAILTPDGTFVAHPSRALSYLEIPLERIELAADSDEGVYIVTGFDDDHHFFQRLAADGSPRTQHDDHVAYTSVVAAGGVTYAAANTADGVAIHFARTLEDFAIASPSAADGHISLVAFPNGNIAAVWASEGVQYMRTFSPDGTALTPLPVGIGVPGAYVDSAALADGRFILIYQAGGYLGYQLFSERGVPLSQPELLPLPSEMGAEISVSASPDGKIIVTWSRDGDVEAHIFDPTVWHDTDGSDSFTGGNFADQIYGGDGGDLLYGEAGDDMINGGTGDDTLYGGDGHDKLFGGDDSDHLFAGTGNDSVYAGAGEFDKVFIGHETTAHQKVLDGGAGAYDILATTWSGTNFFYDARTDKVSNFFNLSLGIDGQAVGTSGTSRLIMSAAQIAGFTDILFRAPGVDNTLEIRMDASSTLDLSTKGIVLSAERTTANATADRILIIGDSSNETITGSAAADTIRGGTGKDELNGYHGLDTADYSDKTKKVTVTLKGSSLTDVFISGTGNSSKEDRIRNFENVFGGTAGDNLKGDGFANVFRGGGGKDTMDGAGGLDTADYSDKTKKVEVALNKSKAVTVKVDGKAEDSIKNFENVFGGSAGDKLTGDSLANLFRGGLGKDTIDGGSGSDTADYSEKSAAIVLNLASLSGGYTNVLVGGKLEDKIKNIENIFGGAGNDVLTGNSSNNFFRGGSGKDTMDGGGGTDTADYSEKIDDLYVTLAGAANSTVSGAGDDDVIRNFEHFLSGSGNDEITGDGNANSLVGGDGEDTLDGGAGKDTLLGGDGDDMIGVALQSHVVAGEIYNGGTGSDALSIGLFGDAPYTIDLRSVLLSSIERVEYVDSNVDGTLKLIIGASQLGSGLALNARFYGSGVGANTHRLEIYGDTASIIDLSQLYLMHNNFATDGNDGVSVFGDDSSELIKTSMLNDTVFAGKGNDTVMGGYGYLETFNLGGVDTLDGGEGNDWLDLSHIEDEEFGLGVVIALDGGNLAHVIRSGNQVSHILNFENIVGTRASDVLTGDANDNIFRGMSGFDTISGGLGNDTADYSENDENARVDVALDDNGDAYVTVRIPQAPYAFLEDRLRSIENIIGGAGNDTIVGGSAANVFTGNAGNDSLNGGGGSDTLYGGANNDTLIGGSGNDSLYGGTDNDTLTGGANDDRFVFARGDSGTGVNVDVITDFDDAGTDRIDLSAFSGTLTYRGTSAFNGLNQVRVVASGADVLVHVNVTGNTNPDFTIKLLATTIGSMGIDDFIL